MGIKNAKMPTCTSMYLVLVYYCYCVCRRFWIGRGRQSTSASVLCMRRIWYRIVSTQVIGSVYFYSMMCHVSQLCQMRAYDGRLTSTYLPLRLWGLTKCVEVMKSNLASIFLVVIFLNAVQAFTTLSYVYKSSSSRLYNKTPLVANGKRIEVAEGSSLSAACSKLGLKVPYKCKKGECNTCAVNIGGKTFRACVGKVPPAPRLKSIQEKGLVVKVINA